MLHQFTQSYLSLPDKHFTKTIPPLFNQNFFQGQVIYKKNSTMQARKTLLSINSSYLSKLKNNKEIKWLDYTNLTIQLIIDEEYGSGIKFPTFTIFHQDSWKIYNYIKKFCIQNNIRKVYSIKQQIGCGKFGKVYLCQKRGELEFYALKCVKKLQSPKHQISLNRELQILRSIEHKNILQLKDVFESEDSVYVILSLYRGGDLFSFIQNSKPLKERVCAKVISQILCALSYIHQQGIIHRDIKPDNILLQKFNCLDDIGISDFGLAEFYDPRCKYIFNRCGTPGYIAPEILREQKYDQKVDIFGVGVILHYINTGKQLLKGNDYNETLLKNYNFDGKIYRQYLNLSESGFQLLQSLLEVNPINRPTARQALNHRWFKEFDIHVDKPQKDMSVGIDEIQQSNSLTQITNYQLESPKLITNIDDTLLRSKKFNSSFYLSSPQFSTPISQPVECSQSFDPELI